MTPTILEWIQKAEKDFATARREVRVPDDPNYDIVCYLAHQCSEKYLKARLQDIDIEIPKTHDLLRLLDLCLSAEPLWETLREHVRSINKFGSDIRYPGIMADHDMAVSALTACTAVRKLARASLKLD